MLFYVCYKKERKKVKGGFKKRICKKVEKNAIKYKIKRKEFKGKKRRFQRCTVFSVHLDAAFVVLPFNNVIRAIAHAVLVCVLDSDYETMQGVERILNDGKISQRHLLLNNSLVAGNFFINIYISKIILELLKTSKV